MAVQPLSTRALCLGSADYGETHRLVDLFTEAAGRMRVVAHGIRKPLSRLSGSLETGTLVALQLAPGRFPGMLGSVREARVLDAFASLRTDLGAMTRVFPFLAFITRRLPEGVVDPGAFTEAVALLAAFAAREVDGGGFTVLAKVFEARLLGKLPDWRHCAGCGRAATALVVNRHGLSCPDCRIQYPGAAIPLESGQQELLAHASASGVPALHGVSLDPRRLEALLRVLSVLLDEPHHPGVP